VCADAGGVRARRVVRSGGRGGAQAIRVADEAPVVSRPGVLAGVLEAGDGNNLKSHRQ
jgi:hypothetical protein